MGKINKKSTNAIQNRNRVNFHREWKKLLTKNSTQNIVQSVSSRNIGNIVQNEFHGHAQIDKQSSTREKLRRWALKFNISKCAVTELLKILISVGMNWLPRDSRSLLETPRLIELATLTKGKLW